MAIRQAKKETEFELDGSTLTLEDLRIIVQKTMDIEESATVRFMPPGQLDGGTGMRVFIKEELFPYA